MASSQITKEYDVFCIGVVLLEIILTNIMPRNAIECLFQFINKHQTTRLLSHLTDSNLHDFAEKCISEVPSKRLSAEQLLKHPFLKIHQEDKELEAN